MSYCVCENDSSFDEAFRQEHMTDLLHWAIENSDPDVLRSQAQALTEEEIAHRQKKVEELSDFMSHQITETDLMKESLSVLKNASSDASEKLYALRTLQIYVERIDNANNLKSLDGIECIVAQLDINDERTSEAVVLLGVAAANNPTFQNHLIETDPVIFSKLIKMLDSEDQMIAGNSLYAISSLLRNLESMRTLFYANGGLKALHDVLEKNLDSIRLKRKSLALLADLIQLGNLHIVDVSLLKLIGTLLNDGDWDIVEKAGITLSLLSQYPDSLRKLKALDLGPILENKKESALKEIQKSNEKSEYLQEIVTSLDKLLRIFHSNQHIEL